MRVDDEHVVLIDDDCGVRADVRRARTDGAVHTGSDLGELVRRLWRRSLRMEYERRDPEKAEQRNESDAIHGAQYATSRAWRHSQWHRSQHCASIWSRNSTIC